MNVRIKIARVAVGVVVGLVCAFDAICPDMAVAMPQPAQPAQVHWFSWGNEAFSRAMKEDKLILLDLTAVWCHACHVMDKMTYEDPAIITLLNSRFIPIRVDTDQRPDIEARYKQGGWPTTSVLLPTGESLFQANVVAPEDLGDVLHQFDALYKDQKFDLVRRAAGVWKKIHAARKARVRPTGPITPDMIEQVVQIMQHSFDEVNGGFSDAPKFFEPQAIALAFRLSHERSDRNLKGMALLTLDKQLGLLDPIWGGFYRYALQADWTQPHYEKMLNIQAWNVANYLEAFQVTGDARYKAVVEGIIQYVDRFLSDRIHGGFYTSQDADLQNKGGKGPSLAGEQYFAFNAGRRFAAGIPWVDRSVYTGWNGLMARSYLKVSQVLGKDTVREFALKTINRLYRERYRKGRGMAHVTRNGRPLDFGLLADQVSFAHALVEAFITTSEHGYLEKAKRLAADMVAQLEDRQGGGLYDRPPGGASYGLLKFPHKPLEGNAQAALLFSTLFSVTENQSYQDEARRTLQYLLGAGRALPIALTALAVDRFLHDPIHIVVVGSQGSEQAWALFHEGLRLYAPGKIVRFLDPARDSLRVGEVTFPSDNKPRAFMCTNLLCSPPVRKIHDMEEALVRLQEAISQSKSLN